MRRPEPGVPGQEPSVQEGEAKRPGPGCKGGGREPLHTGRAFALGQREATCEDL